jgi:DNA polymerase III alpha subunit
LYYYDVILSLTDKEIEQIIKLTDCKVSLIGSLKTLLEKGKINKPRRAKIESLVLSLENPPHSLNDTPAFKVNSEVEFLGCPISTSNLEACFISGDTTIEDFNNGKNAKEMKIAVEISETREYTIRNGKSVGKNMLFVSAVDETGLMQCVAFSEVYQKYQNVLLKGNTVLLHGSRSKEDSFTINKVTQL